MERNKEAWIEWDNRVKWLRVRGYVWVREGGRYWFGLYILGYGLS